jgi:hypothetical protein
MQNKIELDVSATSARAQQDIEALVELLAPEDRRSIRETAEGDLWRLHHGYGMWLRNQFRGHKFPDLFRLCSARIAHEGRNFDAISQAAIAEIWRRLRSPLDERGQNQN